MPLKQSEQKRAAILQAAKEEFLSQGFRTTSMDRVAERAGVSKRTVYNHFENKEVLFRAVSLRLIEETKSLPFTYAPDTPLREQLIALITLEVDSLTTDSHISAFRALMVEAFELPGIVEQIASEIPDGQDPLENWVRAATQDGRLEGADIDFATTHLHALVKGVYFWPVLIGYSEPPADDERRRYIESTVEMFLHHYEVKH